MNNKGQSAFAFLIEYGWGFVVIVVVVVVLFAFVIFNDSEYDYCNDQGCWKENAYWDCTEWDTVELGTAYISEIDMTEIERVRVEKKLCYEDSKDCKGVWRQGVIIPWRFDAQEDRCTLQEFKETRKWIKKCPECW